MMFDCGLQNIFRLKNGQSRSINWENRNGEKGKGGMASSDLGPSRKGFPNREVEEGFIRLLLPFYANVNKVE